MSTSIDVSQLARWSEEFVGDCSLPETLEPPSLDSPVFFMNDALNSRVALFQGDMLQMDVDAMVHATNERFERCTKFTDRLYQKAGPQLKRCLFNKLKSCRTGCVKITKGYSIVPRYIIHTASPRYQLKYQTASENALFNCYYNVLLAAKKCQLRTIALGPIAIPRHNYPEMEATNLGLRVVRRFLETFPDAFDLVVFVVNTSRQYSLYRSLMKLYFPRNRDEEIIERFLLPAHHLDGPMGQPIIPERKIRIKESPFEKLHCFTSDNSGDSTFDEDSDSSYCSSLVSSIGSSKFGDVEECRDRLHQLNYQKATTTREFLHSCDKATTAGQSQAQLTAHNDQALVNEYQRQLRFERLLRKSKVMDKTRKETLAIREQLEQCIYVSGVDHNSRPILTIKGSKFVSDSMCNDYALAYILNLVEKISRDEYVVLYQHSMVNSANMPRPEFLSRLQEFVSQRHRKNLHRLYIANASVWSRMYVWWLTTFAGSHKFLKNKIMFTNHADQLTAGPPPSPSERH